MSEVYDIAIVGSGFAGSLLAMIARRLGRSVVLIEKGRHPRVVIGESSTPLSNLLLEELAATYDLPMLSPLTKWGNWQRSYPEIACGLKRGFTFHHHVPGHSHSRHADRQDQLLVAASPHDEIADTHWYRADFDSFLVRQAQELGATYIDEVKLHKFFYFGDAVRLEGRRGGEDAAFSARFVVDATGPRGFLYRALRIGGLDLPGLPPTQALFNHFTGVGRLSGAPAARAADTPPYPIDDAAVHHVFEGGWAWVLHFNNGVTSAGVAARDDVAAQLGLSEGHAGWERLMDLIPALKAQFKFAIPEREFTYLPRLAFRSPKITGNKWAMLPSAAGFVDPLLSTGFPLTLLGISRLSKIIASDWGNSTFNASLDKYGAKTDAELVAASALIGALYATMSDFPVFTSLTLLYFAAASFSETARRLGKQELAPSFLLHDHPLFGLSCAELLRQAHAPRSAQQSEELIRDILRSIEPFNVAGLGDAARRNWYPVIADDLFNSAHKLDASREDIQQLLQRCGFHSKAETTAMAVHS